MTESMMAAMARYVVRNSNGGILGGYTNIEDANRCKRHWEDAYRHSGITQVKVRIVEQAVR